MSKTEARFHSLRWFFQSAEQPEASDTEVVVSASEIMEKGPQLFKMVQHLIGQGGESPASQEDRRLINEGVWGALMVAKELAPDSVARINQTDWVFDAYESFAFSEVDDVLQTDIAEVVTQTMDYIYGDDSDLPTQAFAYGLNLVEYFDQRAKEYELTPA